MSFEQTVVLRVEEKEEKREERRIFKFEFELAEFSNLNFNELNFHI